MSFNIGTSSTPATPTAAEPNMDMALDDIIKNRRTENKPRRTPRKNAGKGPTTAARATGQNSARRNAGVAARRGIVQNNRPNSMEVDRQVNRQQNRGVGKGTQANNQGGGGRGGNRGNANTRGGGGRGGARRATAPSAASVRAKARVLAGVKKGAATNNAGSGGAIQAPTQQAIGAAARAMKEHGFKPPKGMQMQITFVPKMEMGGNVNAQSKKNNNSNRNT
eukprot:CAMPEP_0201644352 /NCGR_PEP_ID=MMETSP0493-20130528/30048_1 /ASSEMBLY_ACC=CAM_ASM_000838 /TAXON_ID=420259 /ORGANISM="Thalassiosira gravida, Strain GMp14c1" /LENGTH=221 /DNA_ID=CAMNT_0048119025 /DNA_START=29 /DNA_END=690 /DNA_ORIENTATION=+